MEEEKYDIEITDAGKDLEIKSFETLKGFILEKCDQYRKEVPGDIQSYAELKDCKAKRAALRATSKAINDRKILEVKNLTEKFVSQCKEVCGLLDDTADLFNDPIDRYMGVEKKPTATLTIKADLETIDRVEKYLKKQKIEYKRKDN